MKNKQFKNAEELLFEHFGSGKIIEWVILGDHEINKQDAKSKYWNCRRCVSGIRFSVFKKTETYLIEGDIEKWKIFKENFK